MSLRIRRGTDAQRQSITFDLGEPVWTTDLEQFWIGDGMTTGGKSIAQGIAGPGLNYNSTTGKLETSNATLTTDQISEGTTNKYFLNQRAQDATALLFANGTQTGITFSYNAVTHAISATVTSTAIIHDTSPSLGGNLSLNGHSVTGTGLEDITNILDLQFSGNIYNSQITLSNNALQLNNNQILAFYLGSPVVPTPFLIKQYNNVASPNYSVYGITNGSTTSGFQYFTSRGTVDAPTTVQLGDFIKLDTAQPYTGSTFALSSAVAHMVDPYGSVGTSSVSGMIALSTFSDSNPAHYKGVIINSLGYVSINHLASDNLYCALNINGVMQLTPQTAAPSTLVEGMIAIADRITWDPASKGSGYSYPVYYNGHTWTAFY